MAEEKASFEEVSSYPVGPEKMEQLFALQTECAICWSTSDGWPIGVIHRYVWKDGLFVRASTPEVVGR